MSINSGMDLKRYDAHTQKKKKHTVEYYSAIKKNETMLPAATWIDLEIIISSEVSQTKTNII